MAMLDLLKHDPKLIEIHEVVQAFDLSSKQRNMFFSLAETLKQTNRTWDDFLYYIYELHQIELVQKYKDDREPVLCPECNTVMGLYSVNDVPAAQTGDSTDKSVWLCQNQKCMNTIYNKETIKELSSKGGT